MSLTNLNKERQGTKVPKTSALGYDQGQTKHDILLHIYIMSLAFT